jgi:NCAIR mutase (PurE)-related protein
METGNDDRGRSFSGSIDFQALILEPPEFQIDWDRERRTGVPEAILCEAKSPAQIDAIIAAYAGRRLLLTRLSAAVHHVLAPETRIAGS